MLYIFSRNLSETKKTERRKTARLFLVSMRIAVCFVLRRGRKNCNLFDFESVSKQNVDVVDYPTPSEG